MVHMMTGKHFGHHLSCLSCFGTATVSLSVATEDLIVRLSGPPLFYSNITAVNSQHVPHMNTVSYFYAQNQTQAVRFRNCFYVGEAFLEASCGFPIVFSCWHGLGGSQSPEAAGGEGKPRSVENEKCVQTGMRHASLQCLIHVKVSCLTLLWVSTDRD
jgi:hypothetical protein